MKRASCEPPRGRLAFLLALLVSVTPLLGTGAAAQSVMNRPPNMNGAWSGRSGTVHFNFLHRFTDTGAPLRKVINYPTFLLGASVPAGVLVGVRYATNSELVPRIPNEWEAFARYSPVRESAGSPLTVSVQGGYNHAARSVDGELELMRELGAVRLLAAGRAFSNAYDTGESRLVLAGGAVVQLFRYLAVAADYAHPLESEADGAWGVGLQTAIPYTPHSFSLQVSNASTTTLQGASLGFDRRRWGFEFTVPVTLSRYFGSGDARTAASAPAGSPGASVGSASSSARSRVTEVGMTNRLEYTPGTVRIGVGETVRWRNTSDVMHTVTADPSRAAKAESVSLPAGASSFDSGDMPPGAVFEQTFTVAGTYRYFCVPHELAGMIGTVIVEGK